MGNENTCYRVSYQDQWLLCQWDRGWGKRKKPISFSDETLNAGGKKKAQE